MDLEAPLQKPENENTMNQSTKLYKGHTQKQNDMNRNKDRTLERSHDQKSKAGLNLNF